MSMQNILAEYTVSMSEFKKNPAQVVRDAGENPVAVLNHNRPSFYMISPILFETLLDELADRDLTSLGKRRLREKAKAMDVELKDC